MGENLLRDLAPATNAVGMARRQSFGALAVDAGIVTTDQLSQALEEGNRTGERPGEVLVRRGWTSEEEVARVLAEQWELPFKSGVSPSQDPAVREMLPDGEAHRLEAYVLSHEEGKLVVALADPSEERLEALHGLLGSDVSPVVVPRSELQAWLGGPQALDFVPAADVPESQVVGSAQLGLDADDAGSEGQPLLDELAELRVALDSGAEQFDLVRGGLDGLAETLGRTREKLERFEREVELLYAEREQSRATLRQVLDLVKTAEQ